MNIDDLKLPGTDTSVSESPVQASPAPMGPTPETPAAPSTQELPDVSAVIATEQSAPVSNVAPTPVAGPQMTPFAQSAPVTPSVPSPVQTTQTEVAKSYTPVDQVVPKESETIVPPIPVPQAASVPPPAPEPTAVDPNLPPPPAPVAVPVNNGGVTVVNTTRAKSGSNLILVILALLLVLFVINIDTVISFVQKNIIQTNPISPGNTNNNNLVDGFIKIYDTNADYTTSDIRFYNFRKSGDNKLLINYSSEKNHSNVADLKLFIEIYSSKKELLTKEQFIVESIANSVAGVPYMIDVTDQIYDLAFYAKIVTYSEEDLKKQTTATCTYNNSTDNYLVEYKTIYSFTNNELTGYEVNKKVEKLHENKATTSAIAVIEKERDDVARFEIPFTYANNTLNYKVDLNNVNEGYIPLYSKGTTPAIVKINDTEKKWICE